MHSQLKQRGFPGSSSSSSSSISSSSTNSNSPGVRSLNKNSWSKNSPKMQTQSNSVTTEALIVNSNSNVVSDEIIVQLQEQFGDNKQIYVLNNNSLVSSSTYSTSLVNGNQQQPIQYLIVDKDVDINVLLQDPNILSNLSMNQQQQQQQQQSQTQHTQPNQNITTTVNHHHHQQQQQQPHHQIAHQPNATTNSSSTTKANQNRLNNANQQLVEESIQRVQTPPPKRKKFEYKLENKKNSYQDVFLRFLAGEKQPTLESITEQLNKKSSNNNHHNHSQQQLQPQQAQTTLNASNQPSTSLGKMNQTNQSTATTTPPPQQQQQIATTCTNNLNGVNNGNLDKENYYNSSKRENLSPLNNFEYRNSYKDHYDNQGVRLNPAIFKNLATSPSSSSSSQTAPPTSSNVNAQRNGNGPIKTTNLNLNKSTSSVVVAKSSQNKHQMIMNSNSIEVNSLKDGLDKVNSLNLVENGQPSQTTTFSNVLNDHTYKSQSALNGQINSNNETNNKKAMLIESHETQMEHDNHQHHAHEPTNANILMAHEQISHQEQAQQQQQQQQQQQSDHNEMSFDEIKFIAGEFLIHKSTFSGDFDNYDIWCVIDDQYLQKYEPVLLSTGERCHQSADILAQYNQDKSEFVLIKVEEKGKTEQNNIVVAVLNDYEPKNNRKLYDQLTNQADMSSAVNNTITSTTNTTQGIVSSTANPNQANQGVILVTYDDLKTAFDVFLQALLSQYLNAEFMMRIKEIQEEYFKPSIEFIDTILNEKYNLLMNYLNDYLLTLNQRLNQPDEQQHVNVTHHDLIQLKPFYKYLIEHKPKLELIQETNNENNENRFIKCESLAFNLTQIQNERLNKLLLAKYQIKFTGHLYNMDTLLPLDESSLTSIQQEYNNKEYHYFVCAKIFELSRLLHSIKHFKVHFYELGSHKIELVRNQLNLNLNDETSANTELLNFCLADQKWLAEMFEKFKQLLFDVDGLVSAEHALFSPLATEMVVENVDLLSVTKHTNGDDESKLIENAKAISQTESQLTLSQF